MSHDGVGRPGHTAPSRDRTTTRRTRPYGYVRNPMAVAGAAQTAAIGAVVGSWSVIALAAVGAVLWNLVIRPVEEADLAARFGEDYDRYHSTVRCWVPTRSS
ncbi:MAG: methyltransferase [Acidimicrobiales bacterium]